MLLSRLPLISALALLAVLAGSIYWQTSSLIGSETYPLNLPQAKETSTSIKTISKTTHNIAKFKLFGDSSLKTTEFVAVQENLPKTKLKLTLTGVLVSPTSERAGALILGPDKQTQHYKLNDKLPGGATLKQVFADRVIVNRSGRLENLYFIESTSLGIERFAPEEEVDTEQQTRQSSQGSVNDKTLSSARSQSIKKRLSKLKKRLLKNKQ